MSLSKPYGFTEKRIKAEIKSLIPSKEQFYSANNSKCFDSKKECKVVYKLHSTYQSALCGTAFDYLARFCIARIAKYNREESLENTIKEICHTYLMYNMSSLIPFNKGDEDEIIKKYDIPLSKRQLLDFCTVSAKEELDWYIAQERELAGILKQGKEKIEQSRF